MPEHREVGTDGHDVVLQRRAPVCVVVEKGIRLGDFEDMDMLGNGRHLGHLFVVSGLGNGADDDRIRIKECFLQGTFCFREGGIENTAEKALQKPGSSPNCSTRSTFFKLPSQALGSGTPMMLTPRNFTMGRSLA